VHLPPALQAIIKLSDTEPHQLGPDLIAATNAIYRSAGLTASRACVRRGCILLVFDLVQQPASLFNDYPFGKGGQDPPCIDDNGSSWGLHGMQQPVWFLEDSFPHTTAHKGHLLGGGGNGAWGPQDAALVQVSI
jgi:hypothetical protein